MLVFLIHGVATQNAAYGDRFKKKVRELILEANTNRNTGAEETEDYIAMPIFYSSFWGHTFKSQTDQLFNWVRSDIKEITNRHPDLKGKGDDIYRYQELREDFIGKFFGDFLTYMHTEKGAEIRKQIFDQFQAFVKQHPRNQQVVIVAHSLGTLILWDLLFAQNLPPADPAYEFRQLFHDESYPLQLQSFMLLWDTNHRNERTKRCLHIP
jgi:triacylglycerol esterase/lipase EstA (alpha/beta hydrolase family)